VASLAMPLKGRAAEAALAPPLKAAPTCAARPVASAGAAAKPEWESR